MGIGRHSKNLQGAVALFSVLMLQSVLRAYLFCSGKAAYIALEVAV